MVVSTHENTKKNTSVTGKILTDIISDTVHTSELSTAFLDKKSSIISVGEF